MNFVAPNLSRRQQRVLENSEREAGNRSAWRKKASFFHSEDISYLKFLIPERARVLEIGCGTGDTLAALKPSYGVGVDFSPKMIGEARRTHSHLRFIVGNVEDPAVLCAIEGPFDFIVIVDTLGMLDDVQALFERLHPLCSRKTRVVVAYFSYLWLPALELAEAVGQRMPQPPVNVMSPEDIAAMASLGDLEPVKSERRLLSPVRLFGLGRLVNRFLGPLPLLRTMALRHYVVCRSLRHVDDSLRSATVVVPARNERGNIEPAVQRIPAFCDDIEIIFIEGLSSDDTLSEIKRVQAAYPQKNIKVMTQPGKGKADAVFTAFDAARGDVLMILDADLTMPPEQLPKFWEAIKSGKGEYINGSRLIYPMEDDAMRFLNLVANKTFSYIFSWLLNQRYTDTLCGTKVIRRSDYISVKAGRAYFGDFDPFGDFDLIFGAAKLNLKSVDLPIRYAARTYGETQISRFRHGVLLLRMVVFAFFKIKAI
ncbi:MAG: glycosyltransferase [Roseiarcus sp.]